MLFQYIYYRFLLLGIIFYVVCSKKVQHALWSYLGIECYMHILSTFFLDDTNIFLIIYTDPLYDEICILEKAFVRYDPAIEAAEKEAAKSMVGGTVVLYSIPFIFLVDHLLYDYLPLVFEYFFFGTMEFKRKFPK